MIGAVVLVLLLVSTAFGVSNQPVHPIPDSNNSSFHSQSRAFWQNELPAILGRYFPTDWVYTGENSASGVHGGAASCTSPTFQTEAFTKPTTASADQADRVLGSSDSQGHITSASINYATQGVPGCTSGTSIVRVVVCSVSGNSVATNFVRVPSTNYFTNYVDTDPTLPAGCANLMDVGITDGAIVGIIDRRNTSPFSSGGGGALCTPLEATLKATIVPCHTTSGNGSVTSPWTGWNTNITWSADTTYIFPSGVYTYASSPNWGLPGIRLIGVGYPILKYTGTGRGVRFDGTAGQGGCGTCGVDDVYMENFVLDMNNNLTNANDAFYAFKIYRSTFRNIRVRHNNARAFGLYGLVAVLFEGIKYSINTEAEPTAHATEGILFDWDGSGYGSANTCLNCIIEGVHGHGIVLDRVQNTNIQGGTSESNTGCGVKFTANANHNLLSGFLDIEQNDSALVCQVRSGTAMDVQDAGYANQYQNIQTAGIEIIPPASNTNITGGFHTDIYIDPGVVSVDLHHLTMRHFPVNLSLTPDTLVTAATDISFANADRSINSTSTDLVAAGFTVGQYILVAGAATPGNNVTQIVTSVATHKVTVNGFLTNGAAGPAITITTARADIRKIAVRIKNLGASPIVDFWDTVGTPEIFGGAHMQGHLVVMPQEFDTKALSFFEPSIPGDNGSLTLVGPNHTGAGVGSQRGMLQLFNQDDLNKRAYVGIDNENNTFYIGATYNSLVGPTSAVPMRMLIGNATPAPIQLSLQSCSALSTLTGAYWTGAILWCPDCNKGTDPCDCTAGGKGAYAYKDDIAGNWVCTGGHSSVLSFSSGHLGAVSGTITGFVKHTVVSHIVNLTGSAMEFTCSGNPTLTLYECGTSVTCAGGPVTIGTVTVTAAGTATVGTITNPNINEGDYTAWSITAGTCTGLNLQGTATVR